MKVRSLVFGAAALAAITLSPGRASAQIGTTGSCGAATYLATLGLGGNLTGCFSFTIRELGEDAGLVSTQTVWDGTFTGASGVGNNSPLTAGQGIYSDDCGSAGGPGQYAFCPTTNAYAVTGFNSAGELVFGLDVPDPNGGAGPGGYYIYSGAEIRNAQPAPTGYQAVMMQVVDASNNPIPGEFLFSWEDLNSGCQGPLNGGDGTFPAADLNNGAFLEGYIAGDCSGHITPGGNSDSDFNDSQLLLNIVGTPQSVTPEPMTMSLMALGLVGLGGASLRRRNKK